MFEIHFLNEVKNESTSESFKLNSIQVMEFYLLNRSFLSISF